MSVEGLIDGFFLIMAMKLFYVLILLLGLYNVIIQALFIKVSLVGYGIV